MDKFEDPQKQYTVVFRAPAVPIIPMGESIRVNTHDGSPTPTIKIYTRHVDKGLDSPLPGNLWIDARGPAQSLESAVTSMGNSVGSLLSMVALATNAAIGDIEPEIVFEITPGKRERLFLQSLLPDENSVLGNGRKVPGIETYALIGAIEKFKATSYGGERLTRAIAQYRYAIGHWRLGHETMATAHLFMGMEVLTKVMLERQLAITGLSREDLARNLGVAPEKITRGQFDTELSAAVRRDILFRGDIECHRQAKMASDGFEHGFSPFDQVRENARVARDKAAYYLRVAILDLVEINNEYRTTLLSPPYDRPLGKWPLVKYVRGRLIGDGDELAAEGLDFPMMKWSTNIKSAKYDDVTGNYKYEIDEKFIPLLRDGIELRIESMEVWQP